MAFSSHALSPGDTSLVGATTPRKGFFARFLAAMQEARMRQAEREIARYLQRSGGITDSTEREIERRFLSDRVTF